MLKQFYKWFEVVDDSSYAAVMHLSIMTGVLLIAAAMWYMRRGSRHIDQAARQICNFVLTLTLYFAIVYFLDYYTGFGLVLFGALVVYEVIVTIKATIKATHGEIYQYPLTIRFLS